MNPRGSVLLFFLHDEGDADFDDIALSIIMIVNVNPFRQYVAIILLTLKIALL